jgi:hypothetical protein
MRGVGVKGPSVLDVCPGAVFHESGVGTGTCLVYPAGCTANFVYYRGSGGRAPAVANGRLFLGSAGHCSKREGQPVYAAISTPGVGPGIARIGTVSARVKDYDGPRVRDFESIRIRDGYRVYPQSPAGGPQRVYDGCQAGIPLKYYGSGYEAVVGQGKPEAGVARIWYDGGYGWLGPAFGGDSGSGVLNALTNQAAGNLTAVNILDPKLFYAPGEVIGSRMTWILRFLGSSYSLVNQDYTLSRDTTSSCGSSRPLGTG